MILYIGIILAVLFGLGGYFGSLWVADLFPSYPGGDNVAIFVSVILALIGFSSPYIATRK